MLPYIPIPSNQRNSDPTTYTTFPNDYVKRTVHRLETLETGEIECIEVQNGRCRMNLLWSFKMEQERAG